MACLTGIKTDIDPKSHSWHLNFESVKGNWHYYRMHCTAMHYLFILWLYLTYNWLKHLPLFFVLAPLMKSDVLTTCVHA